MLFGLAAALALCFSFTAQPAWQVIAPAAALTFAWLPGLAVLLGRGPLAVRRFEWTQDGQWLLTGPHGRSEAGCLAGAAATLGPWILRAWTVEAGPWRLLRRRYALIGVRQVGRAAFRALRGRLSMLRQAGTTHARTVAP